MLEMFGSGLGGVFPDSRKAHCIQRKARQSLNECVVTVGNKRKDKQTEKYTNT